MSLRVFCRAPYAERLSINTTWKTSKTSASPYVFGSVEQKMGIGVLQISRMSIFKCIYTYAHICITYNIITFGKVNHFHLNSVREYQILLWLCQNISQVTLKKD